MACKPDASWLNGLPTADFVPSQRLTHLPLPRGESRLLAPHRCCFFPSVLGVLCCVDVCVCASFFSSWMRSSSTPRRRFSSACRTCRPTRSGGLSSSPSTRSRSSPSTRASVRSVQSKSFDAMTCGIHDRSILTDEDLNHVVMDDGGSGDHGNSVDTANHAVSSSQTLHILSSLLLLDRSS